MNGVTDADNIGASGRHWNGMGGGEASLRYQRPIYGINSIRNRRGKAFRHLNDQSAVSSIDLVFSSIVRLRCSYPRWELVSLNDIGEVVPPESLTVLLARTDGNIDRYVVGGIAVKSFMFPLFVSITRWWNRRERIYFLDVFPICTSPCPQVLKRIWEYDRVNCNIPKSILLYAFQSIGQVYWFEHYIPAKGRLIYYCHALWDIHRLQ